MRTDNSTNLPLVIYDNDCNFCRYWIAQWQHVTADRVEYAPFQEVAGQFPDIPLLQFETAVQLIVPGGEVFSGAEAVFRALAYSPRRWSGVWKKAYQKIPGFATITEAVYRFVAQHRTGFSLLTRWLSRW